MAQTLPYISAAQVLEAGRKAEREGRVEYAIQFYRHLTDFHARAPEAVVAQDSLKRIGHARAPTTANGHVGRDVSQPPAIPPIAKLPLEPTGRAQNGSRGGITVAPAGGDRLLRRPALPSPARGYRTGLLLASLFGFIGYLLALGGLGAIIGSIVEPRWVPAAARFGLGSLSWGVGLWTLGAGLALIFCGQLARAIFDMANANRDIVEIGRARLTAAER